MALVTTVVDVATLPVRLGLAFTRTTLQLGRLTAPDGPVLRPGGYADRLAALERLFEEGGTLDQLVELGETLEDIRPRLVELADLIPDLQGAVEVLGRSVTPLAELAGRLPLRRRQIEATP